MIISVDLVSIRSVIIFVNMNIVWPIDIIIAISHNNVFTSR